MDNNEELSLHIYQPSFIAKPILNDTLDALNNYPEQLMISIMSANSRDWFNYNNLEFEELSDKDLAKMKSRDTTNDFFELKAKKESRTHVRLICYAICKRQMAKNISPCNI